MKANKPCTWTTCQEWSVSLYSCYKWHQLYEYFIAWIHHFLNRGLSCSSLRKSWSKEIHLTWLRHSFSNICLFSIANCTIPVVTTCITLPHFCKYVHHHCPWGPLMSQCCCRDFCWKGKLVGWTLPCSMEALYSLISSSVLLSKIPQAAIVGS